MVERLNRNENSEDKLKKAAADLNRLRSSERSGEAIERRSKFLADRISDGSFEAWKKAGIPAAMDNDSNGLWINVGPDGPSGIHSHLPFEAMDMQLATALRAQKIMMLPPLLIDGEVIEPSGVDTHQLELEARIAEAHDDPRLAEIVEAQNTLLIEDQLLNPRLQDHGVYLEDFSDRLKATCDFICTDPGRITSSVRWHSKHLPLPTLRETVRNESGVKDEKVRHAYERATLKMRVSKLMFIAENLNRGDNEIDKLRLWDVGGGEGGIAKLQGSHDLAAVNKPVFDARRARSLSAKNYEPSKILDTVLGAHSSETYEKQGIHMVRGSYAGGLEFLGVWSDETYNRVLIDPKKHIRSSEAQANFEKIEKVSRGDFEAFEALILPYAYFKTAFYAVDRALDNLEMRTDYQRNEKEIDHNRDILRRNLEGIRTIALTEFSEKDYRDFESGIRRLDTAFGHESWGQERVAFLKYLWDLKERYGKSFIQPAGVILSEKAPPLTVKEVTFDQSFVDSFPSEGVKKKSDSINTGLSLSGAKIKIIESGAESGIPYAMEGRAMRALGLERRPTMIITGGAKNLDEERWGSQTETMAQSILKTAIEFRANVLVPGTQSGLGITLARVYQEYIKNLTDEERENAPRFFAIEPGKELYYPGNPILDVSDSSNIYAVSGVDTITTPYHAGWSKRGEGESEQRRHNHYRQLFTKRASEGFPAIIVTANGGGWTALENSTGLHDNFPVVPISDTGRLAALVSKAFEKKGEWEAIGSDDELLAYMEKTIDLIEPETDRDVVRKDMENELFRRELVDFLRAAINKQVIPTPLNGLEVQVRKLLSV